jgi:hypothetical protein
MGVAPKFIASAYPDERRAFAKDANSRIEGAQTRRRGRGARRRRDRRLQRAAFGEEHEAAPAKASQHYVPSRRIFLCFHDADF